MRCNGVFRFAALVAFARARRSGGPLDGPLRADRRARRPPPRRTRSRSATRTSRTCSRPSTLACSNRSASRSGTTRRPHVREEAAAAGLAAARRAESQEACFLAGGDYRAFLERQGVAARPGEIVDEDGAVARPPRRRLAVHAGTAPRPRARRRASRSSRSARDAATNTLVVGPRGSLASRAASRRAGGSTSPSSAPRRSSATARRPSGPACSPTDDGFALELDEPVDAVAPGQVAVLYDDDVVVGAGVITRATG